jgi:hypothetical protein
MLRAVVLVMFSCGSKCALREDKERRIFKLRNEQKVNVEFVLGRKEAAGGVSQEDEPDPVFRARGWGW